MDIRENQQNNKVNDPFIPMSEEQFYEHLAQSRKDAEEGRLLSADDMIKEMRKKYKL